MALEGLSRGIFRSIGLLKNKRKLDEEELREMTRSLRRALQEADFNVRQTKDLVEKLEARLREEEPRPGLTLQTHAMNTSTLNWSECLDPHINFNRTELHFFWSASTVKVKLRRLLNLQNGTGESTAFVSL